MLNRDYIAKIFIFRVYRKFASKLVYTRNVYDEFMLVKF